MTANGPSLSICNVRSSVANGGKAEVLVTLRNDVIDQHGVATLATWLMTLFIQRAEHRDTQAIRHRSLSHDMDQVDRPVPRAARTFPHRSSRGARQPRWAIGKWQRAGHGHSRRVGALPDSHRQALDWNGEYVSDAALGLNDARCARVALQLAAQAQDLHVDAAVEHVFMHAGRLQQVLAAQRPL